MNPELEARISDWPHELDLVGGPYCGCKLFPHREQVLATYAESVKPSSFYPADHDVVVMIGEKGNIAHRFHDGAWFYDIHLTEYFS